MLVRPMATILVLAHRDDGFRERGYMVAGLFPFWLGAGHRVVVHEGLGPLPEADVVINHVDLTVVPAEYAEALARYPVAVNGRALDVAKRTISEHLVTQGDGYEGPVIIKTNANCAGLGEAVHWRRQAARALHGGPGAGPSPVALQGRYPVFPTPSAVPPPMWRDQGLVVEKFLPERDAEGRYYLRTWVFFGDRERCNRVRGPHPVVKATDAEERVPVPVPDELREVRKRLGFDYGKFDFTIHDGQVVLFDVNRTPSIPPNLSAALQAGMAHLADGLHALLHERARVDSNHGPAA